MHLAITPTRLLHDVQHDFSACFPYLKLEFFQRKGSSPTNNTDVSSLAAPGSRIGDIQATISDGVIELSGSMKVKELEQIFKDQFGVQAQVFRRSGTVWLQTTMTDEWTLQTQNEHGRELSPAYQPL